nr:unnamed protein product [Naegleria fowleri]
MPTSVKLSVDGMSCEGCAGSVKNILSKCPGVVTVDEVSVKNKIATIQVDSSFSVDITVQSLNKAGFASKQLSV